MNTHIDTQYIPSTKLLTTAIQGIPLLEQSTSTPGIGKINWPLISPARKEWTSASMKDIPAEYKTPDKWTDADVMSFLKPVTVGQLDATLQIELVQYQMTKNNKEMRELLQGSVNLDTGRVEQDSIATHYNYLFNVIRPKLILIKRVKALLQQNQIYRAYHSGNQDLVQYLVHLIQNAEKDLKKYMLNMNLMMGLRGSSMDKYTILKSLVSE